MSIFDTTQLTGYIRRKHVTVATFIWVPLWKDR